MLTDDHGSAVLPKFFISSDRMRSTAYSPSSCSLALLAADGAALVSICVLGSIIGANEWLGRPGQMSDLLVFLMLVAPPIAYLALRGRYQVQAPCSAERMPVVEAALYAGIVALCIPSVEAASISGGVDARPAAIAAVALFPLAATAGNLIAKWLLVRSGRWQQPSLIVGLPTDIAEVQQAIASSPELGCRTVGQINPHDILNRTDAPSLAAMLQQFGASHLLIAGQGGLQREIIECALRERIPFDVVIAPRLLPYFAWSPRRLETSGTVLLSSRIGLAAPMARSLKAAMDVAIALVMIVGLSPLLAAIAFVCCLDGGPALFRHRRVGANGRHFNCLKFRTMVLDSERILQETLAQDPAMAAEWAANQKLVNDPRVTRIGNFLRKSSLDELPQLFNVLCLQMSLVGPRPIVDSEVAFYGRDIAHYYATRPGITGLWQVSGRSGTSYARRVQLDVWYVTNWTIWTDLALLLKTIPAVLSSRGAH